MKKLKYIVFDVNGLEVPVIWPDDVGLAHKEVAAFSTHRPISAGFTQAEDWVRGGGSISLGINSRPEDTAVLRQFFAPEPLGAGSKPHPQAFLFPKE